MNRKVFLSSKKELFLREELPEDLQRALTDEAASREQLDSTDADEQVKAWRILRQSLQHSGDEEFNASMRAQLIEYLCEQLQKLSQFVIQQNDCLENVEDLDEQQLNAFLSKY